MVLFIGKASQSCLTCMKTLVIWISCKTPNATCNACTTPSVPCNACITTCVTHTLHHVLLIHYIMCTPCTLLLDITCNIRFCQMYVGHVAMAGPKITMHNLDYSLASKLQQTLNIQIICSLSSNRVTLSTLTNLTSHFSSPYSLETSFSAKLAATTLGTSSLDCFSLGTRSLLTIHKTIHLQRFFFFEKYNNINMCLTILNNHSQNLLGYAWDKNSSVVA